jgi:N-acetyl-gamma-glutamyl-phosphate reductase
MKIGILGASGYTARELLLILLRHPQAEVVAVASRNDGSPRLDELHPILAGRTDLRAEPFDSDRFISRGIEFVFSCLPHGASMEHLPSLLTRGVRVIDLSADYRLRDPNVYATWYGESHADLAYLAQAVYGLPELYGDEIAAAQLVANPGCYPQTAILGLAPLVAGGIIEPLSIIIDAKSGISGAGRTPRLASHFPECNENVAAYSVGSHRHTPEIDQILSDVAGSPVEVVFIPHLVPMDRGILTTIYAIPSRGVTESQLTGLFREFYGEAPFVRIRDHLPNTKGTIGTNYLDLSLRVVRGRIIVIVAEDNLIRGASGVAVQNFNHMVGCDQQTALI